MLQVDGHKNLVRDPKSGAILNINSNEINTAKARKQARLQKAEKEQQLHDDVDNLKTELNTIKSLLTELVEKLDG